MEDFLQRASDSVETRSQQPILKWRDLPDTFYKIIGMRMIHTRFGPSYVLSLQDKDESEDTFDVWAPRTLAGKLYADSYAYVVKKGVKKSRNGRDYFDFDLVPHSFSFS